MNDEKLQIAIFALSKIAMSEHEHIDMYYTHPAVFAQEALRYLEAPVDTLNYEVDREVIRKFYHWRLFRKENE